MTQLQPTAPLISKILREQAYNTDLEYRWAKYVIHFSVKDIILIYNILTKEYLFCKEWHEDKEKLVKKWFLVPIEFDDFKFVGNVKLLLSNLKTQNDVIRNYTIFTTTDCNARCSYCFESGYSKVRMSCEIISATVNYIKRQYKNEPISIQWFGGEPLFNVVAIEKICQMLNDAGILFNSQMTTNGLLFNKKMINNAINNWHLCNVQITLDGTENKYNKTKSYITKEKNPYARVLSNINDLLDNGVNVTIRLNLAKDNFDDLMDLVMELSKRFSKYKVCSIYPIPLFQLINETSTRKSIFSNLIKLQLKIEECGMNLGYAYFNKIRHNHCKADSSLNSVIIFPDGNIGLCEHEWEQQYIGNVHDPTFFYKSEIENWNKYNMPTTKCAECCLFSDCLKLEKCETNYQCFDELIEYDLFMIRQQMLSIYNNYETKL